MRKPRSPQRKHRDERGAALIVVMSILLILTLLGIGTFNNSMRDFSIAMNRSYAQSAEKIAQSALHLVINQIERDPLGFVTALERKPADSQSPTGCEKARTLCITPASFFPKPPGSKRTHQGFSKTALLPDVNLTTGDPSIYPDFVVRVDPPIKSPYSRPSPGMSLNANQKMCTITLVLTSTGKIINPNITDPNNSKHTLSSRVYRVHLTLAMKGDSC